jgi:hypothetical protein
VLHPRVDQAVEDVDALAPVGDHVRLPKDAQLLRDVGLRTAEYGLQVAYAGLVSPQLIQDAQASWM